jgi:hypothetical protein
MLNIIGECKDLSGRLIRGILLLALACTCSLLACISALSSTDSGEVGGPYVRNDGRAINLGQDKVTSNVDSRVATDSETLDNWVYGYGSGEALINLAGIVVFPPYAIYVVGNGLAEYSGYEPWYITSVLPDEVRKPYLSGYHGVASVPGRFLGAINGRGFRGEVQDDGYCVKGVDSNKSDG